MRHLWLVCCAGCAFQGERVEPRPGPLVFDCGTLTPYAAFRCSASAPEIQEDSSVNLLQEGQIFHREDSSRCDLGPSWCEQDRTLRRELSARCEATSPADGVLRVEASFEAQVSCVPGVDPQVSTSFVSPRWRGHLSIPGPSGRVRIEARASASRSGACTMTLGKLAADPLREGEDAVLLTFVEGPAELDLVLDCQDALAGVSCQNQEPCHTPPELSRALGSLVLSLEVTRCPEPC